MHVLEAALLANLAQPLPGSRRERTALTPPAAAEARHGAILSRRTAWSLNQLAASAFACLRRWTAGWLDRSRRRDRGPSPLPAKMAVMAGTGQPDAR